MKKRKITRKEKDNKEQGEGDNGSECRSFSSDSENHSVENDNRRFHRKRDENPWRMQPYRILDLCSRDGRLKIVRKRERAIRVHREDCPRCPSSSTCTRLRRSHHRRSTVPSVIGRCRPSLAMDRPAPVDSTVFHRDYSMTIEALHDEDDLHSESRSVAGFMTPRCCEYPPSVINSPNNANFTP